MSEGLQVAKKVPFSNIPYPKLRPMAGVFIYENVKGGEIWFLKSNDTVYHLDLTDALGFESVGFPRGRVIVNSNNRYSAYVSIGDCGDEEVLQEVKETVIKIFNLDPSLTEFRFEDRYALSSFNFRVLKESDEPFYFWYLRRTFLSQIFRGLGHKPEFVQPFLFTLFCLNLIKFIGILICFPPRVLIALWLVLNIKPKFMVFGFLRFTGLLRFKFAYNFVGKLMFKN